MERGGSSIANARRSFEYFARNLQTDPHDVEFNYLQEWLGQWLEHGDGPAATGGNYETWLRVCIDIADAVMRHELSLNYAGTEEAGYADARERRIEGLHEPGYTGAYFLDRAGYEAEVYQREHPEQRFE